MAVFGYERYEPANVEAFHFTDPQQQADILGQVTEQRIGLGLDGQHFSAIHANRDSGGKSIILRPNSLFGSTGNTNQQYIAAQYALAFPEHGYLSIDLPAHGASDKLNAAQRKGLTEGNGLDPIVDSQLEAVLDLVPDVQNVILTGEAFGELIAVMMAARAKERDIRVARLFGFDPMSMEERSPLGISGGYIAHAIKSRLSGTPQRDGERELKESFTKDFVPIAREYTPTRVATPARNIGLMGRERTIGRLMLEDSPVTKDIGLRALEAALETQPELRADFVFMGKSPIGRLTEPVAASLHELQDETGGRVQFTEWPNDGQDIGLARHQPRPITYIKDNL